MGVDRRGELGDVVRMVVFSISEAKEIDKSCVRGSKFGELSVAAW